MISYTSTYMPLEKGLHFKSYVNDLGDNTLLVTPAYAAHPELEKFNKIVVDEGEEYPANTLLVNGSLITPKGFTHS